ncbi:MAG: photosystem II S4 domain protein [Pseudanabaenaceae cyanobacterium bins.68]|nr:photosystem II S4 domain protein [Pseudanabaenaceae cyanobacterium bins.68]
MLPRNLLNGREHREVLSRLFDWGDRALNQWEIQCSDFLSPPELQEAQQIFSQFTEVQVLPWGGYDQAERQRLAIARVEIPLQPEQIPLAALEIIGNFLFDAASHRDFLGALLGTGLERQKVGDLIMLGEKGAQVILVPELVSYLEIHLNQVRSVPVKTRQIAVTDLKIRPPQVKELATVEASLRLDAIASAGFGMSRSKMVDLINGDDVRVNWKTISQPSHQLKTGDLIAIRGKGRLAVGEIMVTKKERYRVLLTKYV